MNSPHKVVRIEDGKTVAHLASRARNIHVLSVGPMDRGSLVHDALLAVPDFRLSIVTDYRALWTFPKLEPIHVVVLHNTFSKFEIEDSCRLIRRMWPHAGILVVHRGEDSLDDALYDDRAALPASPQDLLSAIERLTSARDHGRFGNAEL